jgi:hypothetical protein
MGGWPKGGCVGYCFRRYAAEPEQGIQGCEAWHRAGRTELERGRAAASIRRQRESLRENLVCFNLALGLATTGHAPLGIGRKQHLAMSRAADNVPGSE